ncbi:GAF domain-containing protein [Streptomyces sp. NPDC059010]|uniref:GAF domain-containing protein n=1 Tax=Streptomyces sp. NPDC059010 TaxID=3346695 RepID=UPI0036A16318
MAQDTVAAPPVPEVTGVQDDFLTPGEVLEALAHAAASVLRGVTAGASLLDQRRLRYVTALSLAAADLECVQERDEAGPGMNAVRTAAPVSAKDLRRPDNRWPRYRQRLVDHGLVSVTAIPMEIDGTVLGTLSIYDSAPRDWPPGDHAVVRLLIRAAMARLDQAHTRLFPHGVWPEIAAAHVDTRDTRAELIQHP